MGSQVGISVQSAPKASTHRAASRSDSPARHRERSRRMARFSLEPGVIKIEGKD